MKRIAKLERSERLVSQKATETVKEKRKALFKKRFSVKFCVKYRFTNLFASFANKVAKGFELSDPVRR